MPAAGDDLAVAFDGDSLVYQVQFPHEIGDGRGRAATDMRGTVDNQGQHYGDLQASSRA